MDSDKPNPEPPANFPKNRVDEQTARTLAKNIVQKMLRPFFSSRSVDKYPPLNIVDLIYRGAYFTRGMVQFGGDLLDDEVYSIFATFPPDLNRVEDLLVKRIMAGKENPNKIIEAINRLSQRPGSYRRILVSMLKGTVPGGTPGRTKKIEEGNLQRLASVSDLLVPAINGFLLLRKHFPQRSTRESLEFLAAGFPEQVEYLSQHQDALEHLLHDKKFLQTAKTERSRSRLIADAMAGCEFGLKPSYGVRKAKEARRRAKAR